MEDIVLKVVGGGGVVGLILMAGHGIYNAYKEELKGPRMVVYRRKAPGKEEDKEPTATPDAR